MAVLVCEAAAPTGGFSGRAPIRNPMETPAVYDLQTEKFARPDADRFTIGTGGDVTLPIGDPWGNRGGSGNIATLLEEVTGEHVRVTVRTGEEGAQVVPMAETATIYVHERAVGEGGRAVESGETIVLGRAKSELWEGYRVQVFV
jgi:hypothetical protein